MSSPQPSGPSRHDSLRRVREAVARGEATRADLVRGVVEAAGQHALDRVSAKLERKLERRQRKHARREARRLRRLEGGGHDERTRGVLGAVAAFVLLLLAVTTPNWWLVFVAMAWACRRRSADPVVA